MSIHLKRSKKNLDYSKICCIIEERNFLICANLKIDCQLRMGRNKSYLLWYLLDHNQNCILNTNIFRSQIFRTFKRILIELKFKNRTFFSVQRSSVFTCKQFTKKNLFNASLYLKLLISLLIDNIHLNTLLKCYCFIFFSPDFVD